MQLQVPEARLFAVEYPGYVKNVERVLQSLGGLDGIARQLQDNADVLPLSFRQDDPYAHALYGDKHQANCLLVKLTRRVRRQPNGSAQPSSTARQLREVRQEEQQQQQQQQQQHGRQQDEQMESAKGQQPEADEVSIEAVARVQRVYRFSSPADYQYVGLDTRPGASLPLDPSRQQDPPGFAAQPLLCTPPLFAKQPIFDYAFRGYTATAAAAGEAPGGRGRRRQGLNMITFFSPEAPPQPPAPITVPEGQRGLLCALQALLARRPVWVAAALGEALPAPYTQAQAEELLPMLCYRFRNGPWKHAWVKRGFDPRQYPQARAYQAIEYHLPTEWHVKISEHKKALAAEEEQARQQGSKGGPALQSTAAAAAAAVLPPIATSHAQLTRFEAVPDRQSCYLPLMSILDSAVQQAAREPANWARHCSDTSGWLVAGAWEAIRKRVKERFQAILDGSPLAPDGDPALLASVGVDEPWQQWQAAGGAEGRDATQPPQQAQQQPQQPQQQQQQAHQQQQQQQQRQQGGTLVGGQDQGAAGEGPAAAVVVGVAGKAPGRKGSRRKAGGGAGGGAAGTGIGSGGPEEELAQQAKQLSIDASRAGSQGQQDAGRAAAGAAALDGLRAVGVSAAAGVGSARDAARDVVMREAEGEQAPASGLREHEGKAPTEAAPPAVAVGPAHAAAAAGGGLPTPAEQQPAAGSGEEGLLPQGLMASLQDYLAHMPDQGDLDEYQLLEGEDEEEGDGVRGGLAGLDGYVTEQGGYSTEEGGYATDELAGQSEEEED